ncbi:MAG: TetR/AcrR family transcriptional regulator [Desulfobacterales bacterium]|nr:TetR/AcrR family transcriptional regulator [Desulfobacterales bacterium]
MPPKFKFTRDEIIDAGFKIVREKGFGGFSTRSLASELGSSSRPIYSFFKSMAELEEVLVEKGVALLYETMIRERTGDPWLDHGIGYVMFAATEKPLFRSLNDENHIDLFKEYGDRIWLTLTLSLSDYPRFQGLTEEQLGKIQVTRWLFAHGMAFQANNPPSDTWGEEEIVACMRDGSIAIYDGLKKQFDALDETNGQKGDG